MNQQTTIGAANIQEVPAVHNARLTVNEVACLWTTFQEYTMLSCVFTYFERTVQDQATKDMITALVPRFNSRVQFVADIFQQEGIPIPMGFTAQDVNPSAPPAVFRHLRPPFHEEFDQDTPDPERFQS